MTIWCITGLDEPRWASNISANFRRASAGVAARLVVVENGNGLGAWPQDVPAIVLRSEPGAAVYINAGLAKVRELAAAGDWFCKFDSDDFYGRDYLLNLRILSWSGAHAAGMTSIFVRTESGRMLYVDSGVRPGTVLKSVPHGPTLAARMDRTIDFPAPPEPWGEDALWVEAMQARGTVFRSLPSRSFAYCRYADRKHTFPPAEGELRHVWPHATYDLGMWDEGVVEGLVAPEQCVEVPHDPMRMADAAESMLRAVARRDV